MPEPVFFLSDYLLSLELALNKCVDISNKKEIGSIDN